MVLMRVFRIGFVVVWETTKKMIKKWAEECRLAFIYMCHFDYCTYVTFHKRKTIHKQIYG